MSLLHLTKEVIFHYINFVKLLQILTRCNINLQFFFFRELPLFYYFHNVYTNIYMSSKILKKEAMETQYFAQNVELAMKQVVHFVLNVEIL